MVSSLTLVNVPPPTECVAAAPYGVRYACLKYSALTRVCDLQARMGVRDLWGTLEPMVPSAGFRRVRPCAIGIDKLFLGAGALL